MVATEIRTIQAEEDDKDLLDALSEALSERGPAILMSAEHRLEIPESLFDVIHQAVKILRTGAAVSIVPYDTVLTSQQAADYLGVSRPYLISILDNEGVEYSYVGTHRRISLNEIEKYRVRRDAERRNILDSMTREAYEMGLYDVDRPDESPVQSGS
jgi:excisionase family DNA binding protein